MFGKGEDEQGEPADGQPDAPHRIRVGPGWAVDQHGAGCAEQDGCGQHTAQRDEVVVGTGPACDPAHGAADLGQACTTKRHVGSSVKAAMRAGDP